MEVLGTRGPSPTPHMSLCFGMVMATRSRSSVDQFPLGCRIPPFVFIHTVATNECFSIETYTIHHDYISLKRQIGKPASLLLPCAVARRIDDASSSSSSSSSSSFYSLATLERGCGTQRSPTADASCGVGATGGADAAGRGQRLDIRWAKDRAGWSSSSLR
jgi:hypothetical protein